MNAEPPGLDALSAASLPVLWGALALSLYDLASGYRRCRAGGLDALVCLPASMHSAAFAAEAGLVAAGLALSAALTVFVLAGSGPGNPVLAAYPGLVSAAMFSTLERRTFSCPGAEAEAEAVVDPAVGPGRDHEHVVMRCGWGRLSAAIRLGVDSPVSVAAHELFHVAVTAASEVKLRHYLIFGAAVVAAGYCAATGSAAYAAPALGLFALYAAAPWLEELAADAFAAAWTGECPGEAVLRRHGLAARLLLDAGLLLGLPGDHPPLFSRLLLCRLVRRGGG